MSMKGCLQLILALLCCVLLTACQRSSPKNEPTRRIELLFPSHEATLAQQKMCDEQAAKRFKEQAPQMNFDEDDYTSHYDPTANVCYVRINLTGRTIISSAVYDAFDGRVYAYAVFSWGHPQTKKKDWNVGACHIDIPGKPEIECHSIDQFDQLTEKYFGTAK